MKMELTTEQILSNHNILGKLNQHGFTLIVKSAMGDYAQQFKQKLEQSEQRVKELEEAASSLIEILETTDPYWSKVDQVVRVQKSLNG